MSKYTIGEASRINCEPERISRVAEFIQQIRLGSGILRRLKTGREAIRQLELNKIISIEASLKSGRFEGPGERPTELHWADTVTVFGKPTQSHSRIIEVWRRQGMDAATHTIVSVDGSDVYAARWVYDTYAKVAIAGLAEELRPEPTQFSTTQLDSVNTLKLSDVVATMEVAQAVQQNSMVSDF